MNKTTTVVLIGPDRAIHAKGELSSALLSTVSIINRHGTLYAFNNYKMGVAEFEECAQPYTLTEF